MIARLMPTALAMSSICASVRPRSSNSDLVAARISSRRSCRRRDTPLPDRDLFSSVLTGPSLDGKASALTRRLGVMRPVDDLRRQVSPLHVVAEFEPGGDQPAAIDELQRRIEGGAKDAVLMGATGTGKTATVAWLAERIQRPLLVLQPNKTLAAQFANELRQLFPDNAVEYFVSYYDYYQPEAYVPQTDTFIEKDSSINEEVERLRHSATNSLLTRRDVIVVSTVSCIYGLGTPQEYVDRMVRLKVGEERDRDALLRRLVEIQYTRNDMSFTRGTFRVRGDTLEIFPMYEEHAVRAVSYTHLRAHETVLDLVCRLLL